MVIAQVEWQKLCALSVLEWALALLQTQGGSVPAPDLWLLAAAPLAGGSSRVMEGGVWGLVRSARAEAQMPVRCLGSMTSLDFDRGAPVAEVEIVCRPDVAFAPRLCVATPTINGDMRLHFHARGTLRNVFIEPQTSYSHPSASVTLLRICAVGLNFRDVLNLLGEYPGDPGPPWQ